MATELLQPGVSVIQEFRTVSPTIVTPTLVPCAVAPAFQVLEALEQDATGNNVLNTDALASVPAILMAANPGDYAGLDGLVLKVSVNNGAEQEITFSDPTALNLSASQVKDQINAASPSGFGAYVVTSGSSSYVQLRSTGKGDGQFLKVLGGDANSVLGFNDNYESEGVSSYSQDKVFVEQDNFPDPRGIIDELDVDESSIRCFLSSSGANLKEFLRDSTFLRKHKGATYTGGTVTYGSFNTTKFAFKYQKGGATHEFTFATEPGDIATLVSDMNTLIAALSGLTFTVNGSVIDAESDYGYFEVVTPSASSAHSNMGWTDGAKAYTMEPVDDGDGDTKTPFVVVDQDNFNAAADEAVKTGTVDITTEQQIHNLTFEVAVDGAHMQEVTFDGGPIVGPNIFVVGNTLTGSVFGFSVNGVDKTVTFAGGDPISIASAISQINAAAGTTVCYESNASGVATTGGGYLAFQVGGATPIAGGEIYLDYSVATGTAWADLGFTGTSDVYQTLSLAEIVSQINDTMGAGVADSTTVANRVTLNSSTKGAESKIEIGNGTANTLLGFTAGDVENGTPFAPAVGDAVYGEGTLIGYVAVVRPGGYNNRLKLDREISTSAGYVSMYIQAVGIPSTLPATRPTPDLVVDAAGAVNLKHDFLRDTEGNPIAASASLIIMYTALRLDVTPAADDPGLLNLDDTDDLEDALAPINTDNPLGLMLYFMLINAPGVVVTGIGVDAVSALNPDGTPTAYSKALSFLESEEVYALAPASQDPVVHQLFMTHVDAQSDPDAKGERIVFINPEMPGEAVPDLVTSGTDGDSTAVSNEFDTKLATLAADLLAAGVDPTGTLDAEDGVYLDIASDAYRYNISAISGTKVTIRVAFAPGENDDDFFAESNLPTNLISESFTIYVRGEAAVDSNGDPDYTEIAQAYQDLGQLYQNRRVIMVAPELVGATIESTEQQIKGYYLCAAIAGMVGQLAPQQGFTNYPITGFTRVKGSNDVFNQTQMNVGAAGGTYWVIQEVAGGPLTCRHQLTTDLTSIETRELSITKVVDFTAKFMRAGLRNFIGKFNITQPFLDTLSTVVQGQLSFLTESGVIIGGDLNNIVQDTSAPDTVLIDVTLDVPYPCNYIRLTLVI
jgi:hypothetical protein